MSTWPPASKPSGTPHHQSFKCKGLQSATAWKQYYPPAHFSFLQVTTAAATRAYHSLCIFLSLHPLLDHYSCCSLCQECISLTSNLTTTLGDGHHSIDTTIEGSGVRLPRAGFLAVQLAESPCASPRLGLLFCCCHQEVQSGWKRVAGLANYVASLGSNTDKLYDWIIRIMAKGLNGNGWMNGKCSINGTYHDPSHP